MPVHRSRTSKRPTKTSAARVSRHAAHTTPGTEVGQKVTPCLWFDGKAEEAARFYTSIFKRSKIGTIARYGEGSPGPKGSVMTVAFELNRQPYLALNGGPQFKFTPAVSFMVNCETQGEIDELWEKLSDGGKQVQCGWLEDRFGLSWQIIPAALGKLMGKGSQEQGERVMKAMLGMKKLVIAELEAAYRGP
jgi:predicted 3-demethylubiquinone-9 3-methyltransferase (glyoxalase superfamily)